MISGATGSHMPPRQKRRAQAKYPSYFHRKIFKIDFVNFSLLIVFILCHFRPLNILFVDLGADVGAQGHKGREHLGQLEDGQPRPH